MFFQILFWPFGFLLKGQTKKDRKLGRERGVDMQQITRGLQLVLTGGMCRA